MGHRKIKKKNIILSDANNSSNKFVILGTFEKLRIATFRFIIPACQSVRMEQLGSYWKN